MQNELLAASVSPWMNVLPSLGHFDTEENLKMWHFSGEFWTDFCPWFVGELMDISIALIVVQQKLQHSFAV